MSYILAVDDQDELRAIVEHVLRSDGHEVATARDGASALQSIEARQPDLMVLDLWMPGINGFDVCRTVKSNPFTAHIPILMLTAQTSLDHKVRGFEEGADDYLGKPFDPRELRARVKSLLRLVQREGERNPSSGLPGGHAIQFEINRRLALGEAFGVIYLDVDHFKPFADTHGFTVADAVITALGPALHRAVQVENEIGGFAGHIGGDDFVLITTAANAVPVARAAVKEFRACVAGIVGEETMAAGVFSGRDRDGQPRDFPIARLSAAVLSVAPARWTSFDHLGQRATEVKRRAKAMESGGVLMEAL